MLPSAERLVHGSFYEQIVLELRRNPRLPLASSPGSKAPVRRSRAKALFCRMTAWSALWAAVVGGGNPPPRPPGALVSGQPATFELTLDHDFGWDDGFDLRRNGPRTDLAARRRCAPIWSALAQRDQARTWVCAEDFSIAWVCDKAAGGWLYQETVSPPLALWMAGSGHIAQAVAPLALTLDFDVTVFDDRPELANFGYFPPDTRLRVGNWGELLETPFPPQPAPGADRHPRASTRCRRAGRMDSRPFFSWE